MSKLKTLFLLLFLIPGISFAQVKFCGIPCKNRSAVLETLKNLNISDYFEYNNDQTYHTISDDLTSSLYLGVNLFKNVGSLTLIEDPESKDHIVIGKVTRLSIYYSDNTNVFSIHTKISELPLKDDDTTFCSIINYLTKENNYNLSKISFGENKLYLNYDYYLISGMGNLLISYKKEELYPFAKVKETAKELSIDFNLFFQNR